MPEVTIVCGPPCAGKSTYVDEHCEPGDVVLDWDTIVEDLGFAPRQHLVEPALIDVISIEWRRRLATALEQPQHVWVIHAKPARAITPLATSLDADVVEISAPLEVLIARAAERPHPAEHRARILAWHNRYNRRRRR